MVTSSLAGGGEPQGIDPWAPRIDAAAAVPSGRQVVGFFALTSLLFAVTCIGYQHWAGLAQSLPIARADPALAAAGARTAFASLEGSVFFWSLVVLGLPQTGRIWRDLGQTICREDARQALFALCLLLLFGTVVAPWHLGESYAEISLAPFGQASWGLHRRLLVPAMAFFVHLDGKLYLVFQLGLVFALLTLLRAFLRRQGCTPDLVSLVSLATSAFVFHNFQFPGYPDVFVLILALLMVSVRLPPLGHATLVVLGLLSHEALACAVLGPLVLWLPRRTWPLVAAPFFLYGLFWAIDFGFDVGHGWHVQVDYEQHSGPELLLARPGTVLFGMLVANKLLWGVVAVHLVTALRRRGAAAWRIVLPVVAGLALCVPSYDTSRMAGMGCLSLILAYAACWPALQRGFGRFLVVANLLLPSVYVSPFVEVPLGVVWGPGLYLLWPMAALGSLHPAVQCFTCVQFGW
jgi:hypothetical protein